MVSNREIISFLKKTSPGAGFVDTLKIRYRPLICPFGKLLDMVRPGESVFDIGCGSGQFALLVSKFTRASSVHGIEINDRLIDNANRLFNAEKVAIAHSFSVYDGKVFPSVMKKADRLFLIDVMHHVQVDKQTEFLSDIYRNMRPGATLVLKDINRSSWLVIFNKLHDLIFSGEMGRELSIRKAAELAGKTGFKIKLTFKERTFLYPHYFLILTKE